MVVLLMDDHNPEIWTNGLHCNNRATTLDRLRYRGTETALVITHGPGETGGAHGTRAGGRRGGGALVRH